MIFPEKLISGKIIKRYKRFLADIELESGEVITAHTANTGAMTTCWEPGWEVLLSYHDNPKRKLKYSLEMTHNGNTWIGVNTSLPNKLGREGIEKGIISELAGYDMIRPEVTIGESRIDLLLEKSSSDEKCYVEIKNVTLLGENRVALFPDAVTTRGLKHLNELIKIVENGDRAVMLYIIQREDVDQFSPAGLIDPEYAATLEQAALSGVEVLAYQCSLTPTQINLVKSLPAYPY